MYRKLFGIIYNKLSTMVNSGERIEIEGRNEVGLFILHISVLFKIICAFISVLVGLGLFFLKNNFLNTKKYKDNKTYSHAPITQNEEMYFF